MENQYIEEEQNEQLSFFESVTSDSTTNNKKIKETTNDENKIKKVKELSIFTYAKAMVKYVFQVTKNAPKQVRWSIVKTMHEESITIVKQLYEANNMRGEKRFELQSQVDARIRTMSFLAEMALFLNVISKHQYAVLTKHLYDTKKMLWGWIKCKS